MCFFKFYSMWFAYFFYAQKNSKVSILLNIVKTNLKNIGIKEALKKCGYLFNCIF